jgi:hypothetical protein
VTAFRTDGYIRGLDAEALAAFRPTARQDFSPVFGGHAGPKAVRTRAAHFARLVRAFHVSGLEKRYEKRVGEGTQRRSVCQYAARPYCDFTSAWKCF